MKNALNIIVAAAIVTQTYAIDGGIYNTAFAPRARDPDKSGSANPPALLYTDTSYTVQTAGTGTITISHFDRDPVSQAGWPDTGFSTQQYTTGYQLFINGERVGIFATVHTYTPIGGTNYWSSATQSLTLPITVTPGPLTIEVYATNYYEYGGNAGARQINNTINHSVAGQIAYSLNLPADFTTALENLQNQITTIENNNTSLLNRIDALETDLTALQQQVATNTSDIEELKTRVTTVEGDLSSLQILVANNYTELKDLLQQQAALIAQNTAQISQNTADIANNTQAIIDANNRIEQNSQAIIALSSRIELTEQTLQQLSVTVNQNYVELISLINGLEGQLGEHNEWLTELELKLTNQDNRIIQLQELVTQNYTLLDNRITEINNALADADQALSDRIDELEQAVGSGNEQLSNELDKLKKQVASNDKDQKRLTWIVGGSAALAGILSEGVYDHFKTQWEYKNFGTPVTMKEDPEAGESQGKFWWSTGYKPQADVQYGSGGWMGVNH